MTTAVLLVIDLRYPGLSFRIAPADSVDLDSGA